MKAIPVLLLAIAAMSAIACSSTPTSSARGESADRGGFTISGTFSKEDGTPAANVRISVFEKDAKGKPMTYDAVTIISTTGTELVFKCPGTGVTDASGFLSIEMDMGKFRTKERRFGLIAQYMDPNKPGSMIFPKLRVEKPESTTIALSKAGVFDLNQMLGRITVLGI
jgi:hypothetical protein